MEKTVDERVGVSESKISTLEQSDSNQWSEINKLRELMRKLVPIWTTIVLMAMSAVTGSALTFAGMIIRVNGK